MRLITIQIFNHLKALNETKGGSGVSYTQHYLFFKLSCLCYNQHNDVAHGYSQQPASLQNRFHVAWSLKGD